MPLARPRPSGYNSVDAKLLGVEKGLTTRDLALATGESFNKVQVRASTCIEYVRMATSNGRALVIGNSASNATLVTAYPNKKTGLLATVRGYESYAKGLIANTTVRGSLQTLQFVWANCNPNTAATGVFWLFWCGSFIARAAAHPAELASPGCSPSSHLFPLPLLPSLCSDSAFAVPLPCGQGLTLSITFAIAHPCCQGDSTT